MSNMDRRLTMADRMEVLRKFICKMKDSGYNHLTWVEILNSGLTRYYRKVLLDLTGTVMLHRWAKDLEQSR